MRQPSGTARARRSLCALVALANASRSCSRPLIFGAANCGDVNYRKLLKSITPVPVLRLLARWRGQPYSPPVGRVQFGELRRKTPISRHFGFDRGLPIDRYYIEGFLARNAADIRGRVLEIGDNAYTRKYGGHSVTMSDVLHVAKGNPIATFVDDLATADH